MVPMDHATHTLRRNFASCDPEQWRLVPVSLLVQEESKGVCKGMVLILQGKCCPGVRTSCDCHAQGAPTSRKSFKTTCSLLSYSTVAIFRLLLRQWASAYKHHSPNRPTEAVGRHNTALF